VKAFATLAVILMLSSPAAAIRSSQENSLASDHYTARGNSPDISRHIDTGGDSIRRSDMPPEARPLAQGEGIEYISSCLWSDLSDARLDNGRIYCAFNYGLAILDATTGPPFEMISKLYLPAAHGGRGDKLEKHGDYVYFTRYKELLVIDVSDVSHPSVVGSYPTQGEFKRLLYADGALYLLETDGENYGLTILDVSEPANPRLLGATTALGDYLKYISVSGGIAVTGDDYEVNILDVSDPSAPALLSSPKLLNIANAVVRDSLLFAFTQNYEYGAPDSVVIYDLSDPSAPARMGVHLTSEGVNSFAMMLSGSLLFTAGEIIDIRDPSVPTAIADYDAYWDVPFGLDGNTLYKWGPNRFDTFDIADLENPYGTGTQILPGFISDVHVQGDIAYVGADWQGLIILDISDVFHPVVLSELEDYFGFQELDVQGDILFSGNYVVDVSDPANPVILAVFDGEYMDVCIEGDLAYGFRKHAPWLEGLCAFDLSDPHNPQLLSVYNVEVPSFGSLAVKDTLAFITPYERTPGIRILSYSDPTAPELISTYGSESKSPGNIVVAVEGNIMYTRISNHGKSELRAVDIHDPRNPVTIGVFDEFSLWSPLAMVAKGDILYTTDRYGYTDVFDVSDPANPLHLEYFHSPSGTTQNLFIEGDRIYLADYYGFMIAHTPYGAPPVQQVILDIRPGSCPNPLNVTVPNGEKANGGVLPVAILGSDELDVHNIDVSSLELAGAAPLRHSFADVAAPASEDNDCACSEMGPDGYTDLELKFRRLDVVAGLGSVSGGNVPVTLTGKMKDGTPIEGNDCVRIVPRKGDGGPRPASLETVAVTALGPATPNPFNPTTVIGYELAKRGYVTLKVYDVTGKVVATLVDGEMPGGQHEVRWEARDVSSGVYFYRLEAGDFVQTRKMILLK